KRILFLEISHSIDEYRYHYVKLLHLLTSRIRILSLLLNSKLLVQVLLVHQSIFRRQEWYWV
ncbi:MAG: hypothetical protein ACKO96_25350, partial [Flammeovirgaceae bacterium]